MFTSAFCNGGQLDKQSNDQSRISFSFCSHNPSTRGVVNEAHSQLLALNYLHLFLREFSGHVKDFINVKEKKHPKDSEQGAHHEAALLPRDLEGQGNDRSTRRVL